MHSASAGVRLSFAAVAIVVSLPILMDARQSPAMPTETAPRLERPLGTLREQAAMQQDWLRKRLDTFLPPLLRKHGIDMWVIPMREYTEDPIFTAIAAPTTFAARRRTIYVFFDRCASAGTPPGASCVQRIALGGTSQGGVFEARRSTRAAAADVGRGQQAELWGDEQWQVLKTVIEERNPRVIGINRSTIFAFSDGLTSGELKGMSEALGDRWTSRFREAEGLPLELIASRLPEEEEFFKRMQELVWSLTQTMFSSKLITVGKTRTSDLVWWWRQHVNDLGLGTWFQPSVDVQRKGKTADRARRGPFIEPGDLLHCDVGITVARLNTDTQHQATCSSPMSRMRPTGLARARQQQRAPGHRHVGDSSGTVRQRDSRGGARANAGGEDQRHDLFASRRAPRPRRWAVDRTLGLSGRRLGTGRRESDSEHVVFDRAAGDHAGPGMGRTAGSDGAGRRRDHRRRRQDPLGARGGRTSCSWFADPHAMDDDPIVGFYAGGRDDCHRTLDEILGWPDDRLEAVHDYIQWIFPDRRRSPVNPSAPVVTIRTTHAFAARPDLRKKLARSLDRMLAFYGLRRVSDPAGGVRIAIDVTAFPLRASTWLRPGNHNHLRLTRIMQSLVLLGLPDEAKALQRCLLVDVAEGPGRHNITRETLAFWQAACQGI